MEKAKELIGKAAMFADKNAPAILTGFTVGGIFATAIASYKAGPKVKRIMETHRQRVEEADKEFEKDEDFKAEKKKIVAETAKEIIPAVLPPIILGGLTIACAISANSVSSKRIAALSAAYEIASKSLSDYKDVIADVVPKKAEEIKEAVITKNLKDTTVSNMDMDIYTKSGNQPCKDIYTKVEFYATKPKIEMAMVELAKQMQGDIVGYCSLYDLYEKIGVPTENIPAFSHTVGWEVSDIINGTLPVTIATCWDKSETVPLIGIDTSSAYEGFTNGGRFRDEY